MDAYTPVSYELCEQLTKKYSTSFSMSSELFDKSIKNHIYAIYGFARIGDEIVDTYRGKDASIQLDNLESQTYDAIKSGYSTNPIVHAFADTCSRFSIGKDLISPFFDSMRTDLTAKVFTQKQYEDYIYGSAEVIGLMCLKVFTNGDSKQYSVLKKGASALGSAYQKINFLRDIKADNNELGRCYFPDISYKQFNEEDKASIIKDIEKDMKTAKTEIENLPNNARKAVKLSYLYYSELLTKLQKSSASEIKTRRIRIPNSTKLLLYTKVRGGR